MACLGVHFSLDEATVLALNAIHDQQQRLEFIQLRDFWLRAAAEGRYVLFTADQ
jgi:hypothetical protein